MIIALYIVAAVIMAVGSLYLAWQTGSFANSKADIPNGDQHVCFVPADIGRLDGIEGLMPYKGSPKCG